VRPAARGNGGRLRNESPHRTGHRGAGARLPRAGGRFDVSHGALAVPKGHPGWLAYFSEFIEEAKASGFVQRAIERAGLRGVQVAPPAANSAEQEVRSLFDRFILAQNAHTLTAVGDLLLDSPRFMWISGAT
jgi:hypothetical protein